MLPSPLSAVLFDAGGTLVHLDYVFIAGRARARGAAVEAGALPHAETHARRALDAHAATRGSLPDDDAGRRPHYFETLLRAAGVSADALPGVVADLEEAHRESNLWRVPLVGAAETLRGLRARGVRTGAVSNADGRIEGVLGAAGLAEHLDLIVDSHLEGVEKPDPEIFRRALARLDVVAERTAYIGDIYSIDAVGARGAGLAPVIIDPTGGYGTLDCPTIGTLPELLSGIRAAGEGGA